MDVSIRPVREDDAAGIVEVLNPIIDAGIYSTMDAPISTRDQIDFIRALPPRAIYHAAVRSPDGRIVGIQDVAPDPDLRTFPHVGHLSTFVALDARGQGIGRRLSEATLARAREQDFRKLMATIRADNPDGLTFYRRLGFTIIGTARKHARVRGHHLDEVLTELLLI